MFLNSSPLETWNEILSFKSGVIASMPGLIMISEGSVAITLSKYSNNGNEAVPGPEPTSRATFLSPL
ncbi:hypothetical protein WICMUC_004466 [Wickerhamomyces mucosus]|uniref:Uncharacterized protein n=1 Tax=Wickerhamomyces mucosus TaxID=1378264 RepID=A0A9P8TB67_9ASCO|nr:hypothetical protein WICMUC_004466 [Wickerhamomyces mucosus]